MKILKLELNAKKQEDFDYALQETIKQLENGCTSGDLRNENIENGYWEITEDKCLHSNCDNDTNR